MDHFIIAVPIYVDLGAKKKKSMFSLNLNTYRNANFHILNKAKILFENEVKPLLAHLPRMKKLHLTYQLFFGSKRTIDISNICCIVDKFFCDTLVNSGKIAGDDKEVISHIVYDWGGIDTKNPHIKVTLSEIERETKEPEHMQISLSENEIKEAIVEYLEKQITLAEGQKISIVIEQEDTELIAYVDIARTGESGATRVNLNSPRNAPTAHATPAPSAMEKPTKPIQTRAKRTEATAKPEPEATSPEVIANISTGEERIDTPTIEAKIEPQPEMKNESRASTMIFPDATSSAPARPVEPSAAPLPTGKSLFANLVKPVHDTPGNTPLN